MLQKRTVCSTATGRMASEVHIKTLTDIEQILNT